jgi:hypothetical protein
VRANREEFIAHPRQNHFVVAYAPEHHAAGLERADGYPIGEIGSLGFVGVGHVVLLVD